MSGCSRCFIDLPDKKRRTALCAVLLFLEATPRLELGVELLQSSALPLGYVAVWITGANFIAPAIFCAGAGDEARTRYLHLGKVALYQMSYTRMGFSLNHAMQFRENWCLRPESNQRHGDFQSPALPTELQRQMATRKGLEPSTSGVTGRRSNQLNYHATWYRVIPVVRRRRGQEIKGPAVSKILIRGLKFWWEQQGSNL